MRSRTAGRETDAELHRDDRGRRRPRHRLAGAGGLAAVDRWIPGITKVELDGLTRVCTFADGHTQQEAILDYSPAARSYRYTITGGLPVADNRGRFAVQPAGNGALIVWESSFVALDPAAEAELSGLWAGMLPAVLGNLKALIEQR